MADKLNPNRKKKDEIKIFFLVILLKMFFFTEQFLLKIKHINYPEGQFILSMWHRHQCLVYGIKDKSNFYVLISASNDGEIVAKAIEILKLKSVRGSSKRRGVAASLELLDKLKDGASAAIMVDGPRGPNGKVKDGIINIAKLSGIPIVPLVWASKSKNFHTFNSWDKFQLPIGPCQTVALYGKPIYIPPELDKEQTKIWCDKLENEMNRLQADLDENYGTYLTS